VPLFFDLEILTAYLAVRKKTTLLCRGLTKALAGKIIAI
jgi:hypothetical protein